MKRLAACTALVLMVLASSAYAQEKPLQFIGLQVEYFMAEIDGNVKAAQAGVASDLDIGGELDLDEGNFFSVGLEFTAWAEGSALVRYSNGTFDGTGSTPGGDGFNGNAFAGGSTLSTDLEITDFAMVASTSLPISGGVQGIGMRTTLGYWRWEANVDGGAAGEGEDHVGTPYWALGASFNQSLSDSISFFASYDYGLEWFDFLVSANEDKKFTMHLWEAGFGVTFAENFFLQASYRSQTVLSEHDPDGESNELDITLNGYVVRVSVRF